jgi:hypothetical protein
MMNANDDDSIPCDITLKKGDPIQSVFAHPRPTDAIMKEGCLRFSLPPYKIKGVHGPRVPSSNQIVSPSFLELQLG